MTSGRYVMDLKFPAANYSDMQKVTKTCEGKKKGY